MNNTNRDNFEDRFQSVDDLPDCFEKGVLLDIHRPEEISDVFKL